MKKWLIKKLYAYVCGELDYDISMAADYFDDAESIEHNQLGYEKMMSTYYQYKNKAIWNRDRKKYLEEKYGELLK